MVSRRAQWFLPLLLLLCTAAHAQTACPWLTQGTAEAWLQGSVIVRTDIAPSAEGSCIFTLHQAATSTSLEITVSTTDQTECHGGSPLIGIGNQATLCAPGSTRDQTTDTINSRVRKHYFTVRLTITGKPSAPLTPQQRASIVQEAAEEVAGNLF